MRGPEPLMANRPHLPETVRVKRIACSLLCCLLTGCVSAPAVKPLAHLAATAEPSVFAPGVISTGDVFASAFTPDARTVYFVRASPDRSGVSIWESHHTQDGWSAPVTSAFSGEHRDIDPFVSVDGRTLYFNSVRPHRAGEAVRTDFYIWLAARLPDGRWGEPFNPGTPLNSDSSDIYATATADGTVYFVSRRAGGAGGNDLYRARRTRSGYAEPENLGPAINTAYAESNPYVSPDERYLIFFSDRPGGYGRSDLYISVRQGDGWGAPRNLGPLINTPDAEFCPIASPDGLTFFFSRSTFTGDQRTGENVYMVDAAVLGLSAR